MTIVWFFNVNGKGKVLYENFDSTYLVYFNFLDCFFFIFYIFSGMIFLAWANVLKIKPFFKESVDKVNDLNDPWESKHTDDFMSHLIIEFYECGAVNTQIMMTLFLMFRNDKTDTFLPTPGLVKTPSHYIMLAIGLIPRLF